MHFFFFRVFVQIGLQRLGQVLETRIGVSKRVGEQHVFGIDLGSKAEAGIDFVAYGHGRVLRVVARPVEVERADEDAQAGDKEHAEHQKEHTIEEADLEQT